MGALQPPPFSFSTFFLAERFLYEYMPRERIPRVRAILFDIGGTITDTSRGILDVHREAGQSAGFDMSKISDEQLQDTHTFVEEHLDNYMKENDVDIHWGENPDDWLEVNREYMEALGFKEISNEQLRVLESYWKDTLTTGWEILADGVKETLEELHRRGYILGICTRRFDNPEQVLKDLEIYQLISTIQYTAVPGYAKPSPYSLLMAADEIRINPIFCTYVGNMVDVDVEASIRAEMLPILTVWQDKRQKDFVPDDMIVIDNIEELLEIFTGPQN
jgi:phosphoglycolate phosphatase-like HAD superfamily hydrolase